MSDRALLRSRRICGYAAVAAVLGSLALPAIGLDGNPTTIAAGAALACLFAWWWFGHCLEVRDIADEFRDPDSKAERDTEC